MTGMMRDFLTYFPWTITINLMVSLLLAVLVIPFLEIVIIPAVQPARRGVRALPTVSTTFTGGCWRGPSATGG